MYQKGNEDSSLRVTSRRYFYPLILSADLFVDAGLLANALHLPFALQQRLFAYDEPYDLDDTQNRYRLGSIDPQLRFLSDREGKDLSKITADQRVADGIVQVPEGSNQYS